MFTLYANTDYLDIIFLITSIIAAVFPIIIFLDSRRNKISHVKKKLELLEYRIRIIELVEKENRLNMDTSISSKLQNQISDIVNGFKEKPDNENSSNIWIFVAFVSVETFFGLSWLSTFILDKSYDNCYYFLEGILGYPVVRAIGLLMVLITSIWVAFKFTYQFKMTKKIKNNLIRNLLLIATFNLIFFSIGFAIISILNILDDYISAF